MTSCDFKFRHCDKEWFKFGFISDTPLFNVPNLYSLCDQLPYMTRFNCTIDELIKVIPAKMYYNFDMICLWGKEIHLTV